MPLGGRVPPAALVLLVALIVLPAHGGAEKGGVFQRTVSSARRLLQLGVTDSSRLIPPVFVQWAEPSTQPSLANLISELFDCQDRADWTYTWPTYVPFVSPTSNIEDGGVLCGEYAPGGVGDGLCDLDVGLAVWTQEWMSASDACVRSCGGCCARYCEAMFSNNPNMALQCESDCAQADDTVNTTDSFTLYLKYVEDNHPLGQEILPYSKYIDLTANATKGQSFPQLFPREQLSTAVEAGGLPGHFDSRFVAIFDNIIDGSVVRYTTDGSDPSPTHGTIGRNVTIFFNTLIKAIAYRPDDSATTASDIASVEVLIQAPAPSVVVEACLLPSGQLLNFTAAAPPTSYLGEVCREAYVLITAPPTIDPATSFMGPTPLLYTVDGTSPLPLAQPPPEPQGFGRIRVRLGQSAQVLALAFRDDHLVPSRLVSLPGGGVIVGAGPYEPASFRATVGLWDLGDAAAFGGTTARAARRDAVCTEQFDILIQPSDAPNLVSDSAGGLGAARLLGPDCRGGQWDVPPQAGPNLASLLTAGDGGEGLEMGGVNPGLIVVDDVSKVQGAGKLPEAQLSVEAWCSFFPPPEGTNGRVIGGLVGARMDKGSAEGQLFGKGWSLSYEHDGAANKTVIYLSLALAGLPEGMRMHTLAAEASPAPRWGEMVHVAAVYDGTTASIYLDGYLLDSNFPCGATSDGHGVACGGILYPTEADKFYVEGELTPLTLGVVKNGRRGTSELHHGTLRMVRIMKEAMSLLEIEAAAQRFFYDLSADPCAPGTYGPYEGHEPCAACLPGTATFLQRSSFCPSCPPGEFASDAAQLQCEACPPGTAPVAGRDACSGDPCVLGAAGACPNNSHCAVGYGHEPPPGAGSSCVCDDGYVEAGGMGAGALVCVSTCGDGIAVSDEACDDGNLDPGDGCSPSCTLESGDSFACPPQGGPCECSPSNPALCCSRQHAVCLLRRGKSCLERQAACLAASSLSPLDREAVSGCEEEGARQCGMLAARCESLGGGGQECAVLVGMCIKGLECVGYVPPPPDTPPPEGNATHVSGMPETTAAPDAGL